MPTCAPAPTHAPPSWRPSPPACQAGQVLELAVYLSVKQGDEAAFERNYAQVSVGRTGRHIAIMLLCASTAPAALAAALLCLRCPSVAVSCALQLVVPPPALPCPAAAGVLWRCAGAAAAVRPGGIPDRAQPAAAAGAGASRRGCAMGASAGGAGAAPVCCQSCMRQSCTCRLQNALAAGVHCLHAPPCRHGRWPMWRHLHLHLHHCPVLQRNRCPLVQLPATLQNRIAEFHTEVEVVPQQVLAAAEVVQVRAGPGCRGGGWV